MERGKDTKRSHEYELGHTDWELKRLETQAKLVDPMTRRYFLDAGLAPGMRVLDIGSGGGDVAILAAAIVGASGEVVGSDRSPVAVAAASARVARLGFSNVSFREGDPTMMDFEQPFDAIVGRYVLMFSPDATAMLKGLVRQVKPGGIVVFHEVDWTGAKSSPPSPTYDCCHAWIVQTFQKVGTNPVMGLNLHAAFLAAGLPAPTLGLSALAGGGDNDLSGIDLIGDLAATMAPVMEQSGVVTIKTLDPGTLVERMRREVTASKGVVVGRYEIGAWCRRRGAD